MSPDRSQKPTSQMPKTPDAPKPGVGSDLRVPDQRDSQPLKKIGDPPRDQKQAGQDLRNPQERDDAE